MGTRPTVTEHLRISEVIEHFENFQVSCSHFEKTQVIERFDLPRTTVYRQVYPKLVTAR